MGKLFQAFGALLAYFCIGTVLALLVGIAYGWQNGLFSGDKVQRIVSIAQGTESSPQLGDLAGDSVAVVQPSLEEIAAARALKSRDLELREQALRNQASRVKFEQTQLAADQGGLTRVRKSFQAELDELRAQALSINEENARLILENMKPKQSKDQILTMVEEGELKDVVVLLSAMTVSKRTKILNEFKTEEESAKLAEILRLIRAGEPEVTLIDQARDQLQPVVPAPTNTAGF
jgi:hypothetical protein